jgi:hypothetical protein
MNAYGVGLRSQKKFFLLRVVSYQDCVPKGYITALPAADQFPFCSLVDMIRKAGDALGRKENAPQPECEAPPYPASGRKKAPLATFMVALCFEQHASWQGTVCWMERQKKYLFRSALELIQIMDKVLEAQTPKTFDLES